MMLPRVKKLKDERCWSGGGQGWPSVWPNDDNKCLSTTKRAELLELTLGLFFAHVAEDWAGQSLGEGTAGSAPTRSFRSPAGATHLPLIILHASRVPYPLCQTFKSSAKTA